MRDAAYLIRAYLFGTQQERDEVRPALADWLEENCVPEAGSIREMDEPVWVLNGDRDEREILLYESSSPESAVSKCRQLFNSVAERDAFVRGLLCERNYSYASVFYSKEDCMAAVAPQWKALHDDSVAYDDVDLAYLDMDQTAVTDGDLEEDGTGDLDDEEMP